MALWRAGEETILRSVEPAGRDLYPGECRWHYLWRSHLLIAVGCAPTVRWPVGEETDYGQSSPPTGTFSYVSAGGTGTCGLQTDGMVGMSGLDHEFAQAVFSPD